ncbi:hypothetical protein [Roseovarius sp. M141]|uniref:hypothetical protein n=1 Tax=Roseovarius sp. M141 TaxID=2583806 RepID=UPI0020CB7BA7|nr:hypothetical protein [Roseovarius sp. M141]
MRNLRAKHDKPTTLIVLVRVKMTHRRKPEDRDQRDADGSGHKPRQPTGDVRIRSISRRNAVNNLKKYEKYHATGGRIA